MTKDTFISEGAEKHASGIKDNKGRDCGSTVCYGLQVENGKTYLTAYVHANRNGADFCRNGGRLIRCEVGTREGEELRASASRQHQVAEAVAAAKARAAKRWASYNK
jgi:hypothetical protein